MKKIHKTPSSLAFICIITLSMGFLSAGCKTDDGLSEGTKKGARTGALVGLTMGALTGDAEYAVKGAIAGGVAGGAAGNMQDYRMDREDYRAETLAAAIATQNQGGQGEAPQGWNEINSFIGNWNVILWGLDNEGNRVDASAKASSALNTTESITFTFTDFKSEPLNSDNFGSATLSFSSDRGFELLTNFSLSPEGNRFVGALAIFWKIS